MSAIETIQSAIHARISQDPYFSDVPVYLFRPRSQDESVMIQTEIDSALAGIESKAGKLGAAILVPMPDADVPEPEIPGPRLDVIPTVRVLEVPAINMSSAGTGKSAEDLALKILNLIHHFFLQDLGTTVIADANALEALEEDHGRIGYDCLFRVPLGLARPTKVALPQITGTAAAVTITSATASAAIYYTTDGTYPWSGNDTAVLYAAPFAVTSGQTVRATATKTAYTASDLASATIT